MLPANEDDLVFSIKVTSAMIGADIMGAVEIVSDGDIRAVVIDYNNDQYVQFLPFQDSIRDAAELVSKMMTGVINESVGRFARRSEASD